MGKRVSVRNLQIITALESLSFGLMYRFMGLVVQALGASQLTVALVPFYLTVGELLSPSLVQTLERPYGKRHALFTILAISMITHLAISATSSDNVAIVMRFLFSLVNRTKSLCYDLLLENEPNVLNRDHLDVNFAFLSNSGYVLGPLIAGVLLQKGHRYVWILTSFLTMSSIVLLRSVDPDKICPEATSSFLGDVGAKARTLKMHLEQCRISTNWDILLIKYLITSSSIIIFSKFPLLLASHYDIRSTVKVGVTIAYMNSLDFASRYLINEANAEIKQYPVACLKEIASFLLAMSALLTCYAPSYPAFMVLLIPYITLRNLVLSLIPETLAERKNEALHKVDEYAATGAALTAPLAFGLLCQKMALHETVVLYTYVPLIVCWLIIRFYTRFVTVAVTYADACTCTRKFQ